MIALYDAQVTITQTTASGVKVVREYDVDKINLQITHTTSTGRNKITYISINIPIAPGEELPL